jgi:outer membrane protein assembly factor BamB
MRRTICLTLALGLFASGLTQVPTYWRGPFANGTYPPPANGLLEEWPPEGPDILWSYEDLEQGFSSAAVSGGSLFTSGMIGEEGYLFKFDLSGNLLWKKKYGPEFTQSWYGTRGTPVIDGDKVYLESGMGLLVCMNAADGSLVWSKDLFSDFDGRNITWGVNETPVVDGDIIYATPGGRINNIVALNRHTGALIWSSKGLSEQSAYCTPLLVDHYGRKILVTHTASHLIALDAKTGRLLWSQPQTNQWSVHANTPIYHDGSLFYFSGYGQGGGLLKLSRDGESASQVWFRKDVDSRIGGAVLVDGFLYLSGDQHREWKCVDWETGEERYTSASVGKGVVISSDGLLYCYSERGELALVKANPSGFDVLSRTTVQLGSAQHWAHPMIHDGVLYLRHGKALIAYAIGK